MEQREWLAQQFEENRAHLRGVAYRMLGSLSEAEDAVQQAWLRLNSSDASGIDNLGGWLTTVVARLSLDTLRSRKSRGEESLETQVHEPVANPNSNNPETELLLADSVGLALLVVLDTLAPAERLAFVLHDMFDLPFEEIAGIVGRSTTATRQLASRARRRVHGSTTTPVGDLTRQRKIVEAFLAASRAGDFNALISMLDPDVVLRSDPAALPPGAPAEIRGAEAVARRASVGRAQAARPAIVNGAVGVIVAPHGKLRLVINFTIRHGKIAQLDVVGDPTRLAQLELAVFND